MEFTVRDWMMDVVVYVDPEATVMEALGMMRRRYIQSLIVKKSETNKDFGILTSTDICDKIIAQNRNPSLVKVKDVMTSPLLMVKTTDGLIDCSKKMREHKIHHLPVEDEEGNLVGVITATDFLVAAEAMGRAPGERIS
jgi:CBS domain-containing protein